MHANHIAGCTTNRLERDDPARVDRRVRSPTPNWNSENIMLLTVLLPATNAPMPPMNGAKIGHALPASRGDPVRERNRHALIASRRRRQLLRKTCTMGTVNTSATDAAAVVFSELVQALL